MLDGHRGRLTKRLSGLVGTGALLLAILSCSTEGRYRVLSFFFEGVPPPGSVPIETVTGRRAGRLVNPASIHTVFRENDCAACHVARSRVFKTPIPELCWECHEPPPASDPWMHAPVRAGVCTACHVGHESEFPALLIAAGPALCFRCHREEFVREISAHEKVDLSTCENCHPPHEGGTVGVPRRIEEAPAIAPMPMVDEGVTTGPRPLRAPPAVGDLGTTQPRAVPPIF